MGCKFRSSWASGKRLYWYRNWIFSWQLFSCEFLQKPKSFPTILLAYKFCNNIREIAEKLKDAGYNKEKVRNEETDPKMPKSRYFFIFTLYFIQKFTYISSDLSISDNNFTSSDDDFEPLKHMSLLKKSIHKKNTYILSSSSSKTLIVHPQARLYCLQPHCPYTREDTQWVLPNEFAC